MASKIHAAVTQNWVGKALPLSNERWLERAHASERNRDRSNLAEWHHLCSAKV